MKDLEENGDVMTKEAFERHLSVHNSLVIRKSETRQAATLSLFPPSNARLLFFYFFLFSLEYLVGASAREKEQNMQLFAFEKSFVLL